jgi:hypothetical protein
LKPSDELLSAKTIGVAGGGVGMLVLQIEELQDQLAKAALHNKGVRSDKLLLQQLNAVEAAYAELQEATVRARKGLCCCDLSVAVPTEVQCWVRVLSHAGRKTIYCSSTCEGHSRTVTVV